ncbi:hypothetical protein ACN24L_25050 [Streptomyces microflavus]
MGAMQAAAHASTRPPQSQ